MSKKVYLPIVLLAIVLASFVSPAGMRVAQAASACGTTYTVRQGDTLFGIARNCGTTVSALRLANPGLGNWVYTGQSLVLPGAFWDNGNGTSTYVVAHGDTLKAIAARYGTTVDALGRLNGIYNYNLIYAGQRLTIPNGGSVPPPPPPPPSGATYTIRLGDTLRKLAHSWGVTVNDILAVNPQITNPSLIFAGQVINRPGASAAEYYTVQRGDTLRLIAARYGTTVYNLQVLNPQIWDPNRIYVGMVIRVR